MSKIAPFRFDPSQTSDRAVVVQFMSMTSQEAVDQAERELAKVKGLVDEQYSLVVRLKRSGADTQEAVRLLIDLLELQQTREQRLAQAQIHQRRGQRQTSLIS